VEVKTAADYQAVYQGSDGTTLIVDDAEPPDPVGLDEATRLARRTLESQFNEGEVAPARPAQLDGEAARRFEGTGDGRTVALLVCVRGEKTWTLTLNGSAEGFSPAVLDRAVESWRWD
jgi:hypothetical protein